MSSLLDLNTPKALLLVHYNIPSNHSNPRHTLQTQYCVSTLRRLSNPLTPCHKQSTDYTDSVPLTNHTEMNQKLSPGWRASTLFPSFTPSRVPQRASPSTPFSRLSLCYLCMVAHTFTLNTEAGAGFKASVVYIERSRTASGTEGNLVSEKEKKNQTNNQTKPFTLFPDEAVKLERENSPKSS